MLHTNVVIRFMRFVGWIVESGNYTCLTKKKDLGVRGVFPLNTLSGWVVC